MTTKSETTKGARVRFKREPDRHGTICGGYTVGCWQFYDVDWDDSEMSACAANDLEILCFIPASREGTVPNGS